MGSDLKITFFFYFERIFHIIILIFLRTMYKSSAIQYNSQNKLILKVEGYFV